MNMSKILPFHYVNNVKLFRYFIFVFHNFLEIQSVFCSPSHFDRLHFEVLTSHMCFVGTVRSHTHNLVCVCWKVQI